MQSTIANGVASGTFEYWIDEKYEKLWDFYMKMDVIFN